MHVAKEARMIGTAALCALLAGTGWAAPSAKKPVKAAPKPAVGGPVFVDNTPLTDEQKIVHVLNRLGFGPRPGDVERVRTMGIHQSIESQLAPERIGDADVEAKLARFTYLKAPSEQLMAAYIEERKESRAKKQIKAANSNAKSGMAMGTAGGPGMEGAMTARQQMRRAGEQGPNQVAAALAQLQTAKVLRAVESERQLQEVLVDFWTNHFNIDVRKGLCRVFKPADDRDVIRPHVFSRFRDLLGASAHSAAMLVYLDNAQSQVPQPVNQRAAALLRRRGGAAAALAPAPGQKARGGINENYGRELMELHTLGVEGGYTQKDVQEVARCLTGWGIDRQTGAFAFSPRRHDNGEKIVLGQHIPAGGGQRDGDRVLDLLAAHPATARFISTKLCRRLVSDEPPAALIDRCVRVWNNTDGDLRAVVRTIVTSNEFFSRAAYRQKIKSPFEMAVSSVRALGGTMDFSTLGTRRAALGAGGIRNLIGQGLAGQVATMGQPLFQYQAPTGYSEDSRKWVSSGALISRLNFALSLTNGKLVGVRLNETNAPGAEHKMFASQIAERLLHGDVSPATRATLLKQVADADDGDGAASARRITALVLGSPEFQRR